MSVFPTQILLATDGSDEAKLATEAATELSKGTGSEVHLVYWYVNAALTGQL